MKKFLIITTYVSILGVLIFTLSQLWGAQDYYFLMFAWFIIPIFLVYAVTFAITFLRTVRTGIGSNRAIFFPHLFSLIILVLMVIYNSDFYKSRIIMDTVLQDDLNSIRIIYRENGEFETTITGMFGFTEKLSGRYLIKGDTIQFLDMPYSNDLIPDEVLMVKSDSAIFFDRNDNNDFVREKTFARYFEIQQIEL